MSVNSISTIDCGITSKMTFEITTNTEGENTVFIRFLDTVLAIDSVEFVNAALEVMIELKKIETKNE
jgi:hypothetical protein